MSWHSFKSFFSKCFWHFSIRNFKLDVSTRGTGKNCNFSPAEDIKVLRMKNKWVYDRILTSLFGIPICMFSIQKKLIRKKRKKNQGEEKYKEKKTWKTANQRYVNFCFPITLAMKIYDKNSWERNVILKSRRGGQTWSFLFLSSFF